MSNSPMPAALPVEIPTAARAAGYDALMQARSEGRELGQGYASALDAAVPGIVAAELRRLAAETDAEMASLREQLRPLAKQVQDSGEPNWLYDTLNKREGILLFFRGTLLDRAEELEAIAGVR
jgi:hypothetical protein